MSLCTKFQPNVFNKTKCQNCFKPKETHSAKALELCHTTRSITRCGFMFVAPDTYDFSNPSDRSRRWQRRFFVLYDDGELRYSVDDNVSTIPQGTIDMTKCIDISKDAEPVTSHKLSMSLTLKDKVIYIRAGNKEERNRWYEILSVYLKQKKSVNTRLYGSAAGNIYSNSSSNLVESLTPYLAADSYNTFRSVRHLKTQTRLRSLSMHDLNTTTWKERSMSPISHDASSTSNETDEYKISKSSESLRCNMNCDNNTGISKTGWLVIMSPNNKDWVKRWFLLQSNKLHYYADSDTASNKIGLFDLKIGFNVAECNVTRSYDFKIETQHGDIILSAMTSQIRASWIAALRSQIPRRTSSASSTTSTGTTAGSSSTATSTSAWPYSAKQQLTIDDDLSVKDVNEMMERRAIKRDQRSKSLVYPVPRGCGGGGAKEHRRLTESTQIISAAAAVADYMSSSDIRMNSDTELIKSLQSEIANLKQRIDASCSCNNKNCEQDATKLKTRNGDLSNQIDDAHKQIAALNNSLANCQEQLKKERNAADLVSRTHQQELEVTTEDIRQMKRGLDDARNKIEDLICTNLNLSEDHHLLIGQFDRQKSELYVYDQKYADECKRLDDLAEIVDTLTEEMTLDRRRYDNDRSLWDQREQKLSSENERLTQYIEGRNQEFAKLEKKLSFVRKEFADSSEKQLTTSAGIIDRLNEQIEVLNVRMVQEKQAPTAVVSPTPAPTPPTTTAPARPISSIEMDYEVKLCELNAKLLDATKKLNNMDRRNTRNQRYSSGGGIGGTPVGCQTHTDPAPSLRLRISSLEQRNHLPRDDNARLYDISTDPSYTSIDQIQADISYLVQERCLKVNECLRQCIAEQITREALVLRKLADFNDPTTTPPSLLHTNEVLMKSCLNTLNEAYQHLTLVDTTEECHRLDNISAFLSSKLFLIESLTASTGEEDIPSCGQTSGITALLTTYNTHSRVGLHSLFSIIEGFCYHACSVLSSQYNDLDTMVANKLTELNTEEQYTDDLDATSLSTFTCTGDLTDPKLYDYLATLLAYSRLLRVQATPPSCRFLLEAAIDRDLFLEALDLCSPVELDTACRAYQDGGLLENIRVEYQNAVRAATSAALVDSNESLHDKLQHSESIIEKLDAEIKRLWHLLDANESSADNVQEILKIKEMYESEIVRFEDQMKTDISDMKMKYDDEINDKSLLLEEETIAAEDTISSMKQQHLVEVAHFQDIIDDLQRSDDLDCADKKLQDENDQLQNELTRTETQLVNSDNECIALKERIGHQLVDLHNSRKRVQDLIRRNEHLNEKLSRDLQELIDVVDAKKSLQITAVSIEEVTLELKLKDEQIWQLKEDLVSRSNELHDTTDELETTIEMFHELHKKHNEMQERLSDEIQQLRIQLFLKSPLPSDEDMTPGDDLDDDDLDPDIHQRHSIASNLSPVRRKQQWRLDKELENKEKHQQIND